MQDHKLIEQGLMIRQGIHLPPRQTQGFMDGLVTALDTKITIPDSSSLAMRSVILPRRKLTKVRSPAVSLLFIPLALRFVKRISGS